jgi:hypothetical protein
MSNETSDEMSDMTETTDTAQVQTDPTTAIETDQTTEVETAPTAAVPLTPAAGREEGRPTEAREQPAEPSAQRPGPAAGPGQSSQPGPAGPATTAPLPKRGPSVPTVIWGLLFALVAATVITVEVSDVDLNLDVTGPTALLVAGALLVLWGIAGLGRGRARRG